MYDLKIIYDFRESFLNTLELLHGCWEKKWKSTHSETMNVELYFRRRDSLFGHGETWS